MEGTARRVLGVVYREMGELVRSEEEFQEGKKLLEEVGLKVEMPTLLYEYGLLLKKMRRGKEAERQLREALALSEEMGMELWVERCESVLDQ